MLVHILPSWSTGGGGGSSSSSSGGGSSSISSSSSASRADQLRKRAKSLTSSGALSQDTTTLRFDEIDDTRPTVVSLGVHATAAELKHFAAQGYLVRPGLLSAAGIARLGAALGKLISTP